MAELPPNVRPMRDALVRSIEDLRKERDKFAEQICNIDMMLLKCDEMNEKISGYRNSDASSASAPTVKSIRDDLAKIKGENIRSRNKWVGLLRNIDEELLRSTKIVEDVDRYGIQEA